MKPNKIIAGKAVVYSPPRNQSENGHCPARIIDTEIKRGRIKVELLTIEGIKKRSVSINRLEEHADLFGGIEWPTPS